MLRGNHVPRHIFARQHHLGIGPQAAEDSRLHGRPTGYEFVGKQQQSVAGQLSACDEELGRRRSRWFRRAKIFGRCDHQRCAHVHSVAIVAHFVVVDATADKSARQRAERGARAADGGRSEQHQGRESVPAGGQTERKRADEGCRGRRDFRGWRRKRYELRSSVFCPRAKKANIVAFFFFENSQPFSLTVSASCYYLFFCCYSTISSIHCV